MQQGTAVVQAIQEGLDPPVKAAFPFTSQHGAQCSAVSLSKWLRAFRAIRRCFLIAALFFTLSVSGTPGIYISANNTTAALYTELQGVHTELPAVHTELRTSHIPANVLFSTAIDM
jgi:hypothetical protein